MRKTILFTLFFFLIFQLKSQVTTEDVIFDYNSEIKIKKAEKLNDSPYAMFGDNTSVLKTEHEKNLDHTLKVPLIEDSVEIGLFELDFQTGIASIKDSKGNIEFEQQLSPDQLSRFLMIDPHAENYYGWSPYVYCANNPIRIIDPTGKDWFVNNETGNMYFIKGVTELTNDLKEKYNLGNANFENLGNDNMFGEDVIWGIYGEEKGGAFNVLDKDFHSFGGLSRNFMDLNGYQGIEEIQIEKSINTEYSTDNSRHTREEYKLMGTPNRTYIKKGINIDSKLKHTKQPQDNITYYSFSNKIETYRTATIPMGEANNFISNLNGNSYSKSAAKAGKADWGGVLKHILKKVK